VEPLHRFVPDALAAILRRAPLTEEKVSFAWRTAVGPAVHHATTVSWRSGTLVVKARDDAWRREVQRSAGLIRARLDALLGDGVVQAIEVSTV
jgi:hypothetical protein